MEDIQHAENPDDHHVNEVYHVENREENKQSTDRKGLLTGVQMIGAVRLVGFLYWTNLAVIIFLLIGFVAPGWVTFTANHRLYYQDYTLKKAEADYKSVFNVYQDYALWYMTQCIDYNEYDDVDDTKCETMTYRTIGHICKNKYYEYSKIEIGNKELEGDDICLFRGAGVVMNFSKMTRVQTLYTAGFLLSLGTLYIWTGYRALLANGQFKSLSRLKWLIMLAVSALSAVTLLDPVIVFALVRGDVFKEEYDEKMETSLGSVFACLGGGLMAIMAILVFLQLLCCRTPDTYICSCTDESGKGASVVEN
ncbi:uncharacterized protein LOC132757796 isoform X2 [Ruditapes philippinarum]|nr:uncharacterized protein LOC132757796 isoform X2 [Ruditapes philippinarum]XP_060605170.1 uncharacterized protein LOC132757796 isoform X2 [Ruditapes philippinarum]